MLTFDKDTIQFSYIEKSHLKSSLAIANNNDQYAYYKVICFYKLIVQNHTT